MGEAATTGLRERNRVRTRNDILDAVAWMLGEFGYTGTTMEDVAKRAGLSRKTIYAYFPEGRDEMVQAAYTGVAERVAREGIAAREEHGEVVERIMALAEAFVRVVAEPEGRFYGLLGPEVTQAIQPVRGATSRSFVAMIWADLDDARSSGLLRGEAPVDELAELLTGAMRAAGSAVAEAPDRAEALLAAIRILVQGLLGRHIGGSCQVAG